MSNRFLGALAISLVSLALGMGCGGQPQLVVAYPNVKSMDDQLYAGAKKLGCAASPSGGGTLVKCPDKRITIVTPGTDARYRLTCFSGSESACQAFVDELLAAGT